MIPKDKEIGSQACRVIAVAARFPKLQRRKSYKGDNADWVYHDHTCGKSCNHTCGLNYALQCHAVSSFDCSICFHVRTHSL